MFKILLATFIFLCICSNSESKICPLVTNCYCWTANTTEIYCHNVTDTTEIELLFKLYHEIYKLSISGSLTTIPSKAFAGVSIKVLVVRGPLTSLPEDALDEINNLQIVNFGETLFSEVPKALAMTTLKVLQMNYGSLSELENQLQNMTATTDFIFNNNQIKSIAGDSFLGTHSLQYLNLSFNHLSYLKPETFAHLTLLKQLDLKNNQLYTVDGCFSSLNPQMINLYGNNLTNIMHAFHKGMWAVKWLDLGGNLHLNLSGSIFDGFMRYLYVLRVSDNELGYLDPYLLKGFPMLQDIHLNRNNLSSIPGNFFSYSKELKVVELNDNNLESLDGLFPEGRKNSIRYLHVSGNNLTSLNLSEAFEDILELDVSRNNIQNLKEQDLENLISVEILNMSGNPLRELESYSFDNLHKLSVLDLSHSELMTLNHSINHKYFLRNLTVSYSSLQIVEEDELVMLRWIKSINFRHNNLQSIYRAFRNLSSIRAVDVSMNNLTTITEDSFPPLTQRSVRNVQLWMADNPWSCDCRLLWILEWLSQGCSLEDEPVCQSPEHFRGREIRSLNQSDLEIWPEDCPELCTCYCVPNKQSIYTKVNCTSVGLKDTPQTFPASVREIYLQDNEITVFDGLSTTKYDELHTLDLEGNNLTKVELVLPPTTKVLLLSKNSLGRFPYENWSHTYLEVVTLSENPWICDCEAWNFRNWLVAHNNSIPDLHDVRCRGTGPSSLGNKVIIELDRTDMCPEESASYIILFIAIGIIFGIICIFCFFFRLSIAAWLYSCGFKNLKKLENNSYLYDAFLLYAEADEEFALAVIAKGLENESPKFDLCIPIRDVKSPRNEENVSAILPACNKVIVILTSKFIEEYSCMLLLRAAMSFTLEDSSKHFIIVTNGKLPLATHLDNTLSSLIKSCPCLQWGEFLFWKKLRYNLPRRNQVESISFTQDDKPLLTSNHS